eukprot:scaffold270165_cov30-Tisochrysis_lutea.AAC.1
MPLNKHATTSRNTSPEKLTFLGRLRGGPATASSSTASLPISCAVASGGTTLLAHRLMLYRLRQCLQRRQTVSPQDPYVNDEGGDSSGTRLSFLRQPEHARDAQMLEASICPFTRYCWLGPFTTGDGCICCCDTSLRSPPVPPGEPKSMGALGTRRRPTGACSGGGKGAEGTGGSVLCGSSSASASAPPPTTAAGAGLATSALRACAECAGSSSLPP